jgi:hypothetical protein
MQHFYLYSYTANHETLPRYADYHRNVFLLLILPLRNIQ